MISGAGEKKLNHRELKSNTKDEIKIIRYPSEKNTCCWRSIKWLSAIVIFLLLAKYHGGYASIAIKLWRWRQGL